MILKIAQKNSIINHIKGNLGVKVLREIKASQIVEVVKKLCTEANYNLPDDILKGLKIRKKEEKSPLGQKILEDIILNAEIAMQEKMAICQDTGMAVVFVEIGQEVRVVDGDLEEAINEGVRLGYKEGYLRKSVVKSPIERINTDDNTPAIIHYRVCRGDRLIITVMPKGAGSENMSALKMLKPSDGLEGVKRFVIETVEKSGPNACPPLIVGVGLGGDFEYAAYLAKKALLRKVGERHQDILIARLEEELLNEINSLGIGPMGLGGTTTALDVHIEVYPTHIASLPVAVNLGCHATRHATFVL
ncbi:fumarate hydratase [Caldanaerobacter subterraneus subsp. yonseiensis KB-1]|uniref:Fumarate hydratase n=1 Tax=Caldanaerobacter subterraneus subsp. yonseiensis KB-1 TaxID=1388761 RepID=U5CE41_CALSX|nr:fumarate hydratase [Caldanaerobacter subterraneus subsp. yonseiensis KB-1]